MPASTFNNSKSQSSSYSPLPSSPLSTKNENKFNSTQSSPDTVTTTIPSKFGTTKSKHHHRISTPPSSSSSSQKHMPFRSIGGSATPSFIKRGFERPQHFVNSVPDGISSPPFISSSSSSRTSRSYSNSVGNDNGGESSQDDSEKYNSTSTVVKSIGEDSSQHISTFDISTKKDVAENSISTTTSNSSSCIDTRPISPNSYSQNINQRNALSQEKSQNIIHPLSTVPYRRPPSNNSQVNKRYSKLDDSDSVPIVATSHSTDNDDSTITISSSVNTTKHENTTTSTKENTRSQDGSIGTRSISHNSYSQIVFQNEGATTATIDETSPKCSSKDYLERDDPNEEGGKMNDSNIISEVYSSSIQSTSHTTLQEDSSPLPSDIIPVSSIDTAQLPTIDRGTPMDRTTTPSSSSSSSTTPTPNQTSRMGTITPRNTGENRPITPGSNAYFTSDSPIKILTDIIAKDASNRSCADCGVALVDTNQIYASFYNPPSFNRSALSSPSSCKTIINNHDDSRHNSQLVEEDEYNILGWASTRNLFFECHEAFAPPNLPTKPSTSEDHEELVQKRARIVERRRNAMMTMTHGVFICRTCSKIHEKMGVDITCVKSICGGGAFTSPLMIRSNVSNVNGNGSVINGENESEENTQVWKWQELEIMKNSGGNARSKMVQERYMSKYWKHSILSDREVFIRAKYQCYAFLLPQVPLNNHMDSKSTNDNTDDAVVSNSVKVASRLVDYFCVIGSNGQIEDISNNGTKVESPEDVCFRTHLIDCYPNDHHDDMTFPHHLPKFVFPDGCRPREKQVPPTFFSFALTCDDGTKLYGAALCIYDETIDMNQISDAIYKSNHKNKLPSWLSGYGEADMNSTSEETIDDEEAGLNSLNSFETTQTSYSAPQHFFMPKCLVLLSHHGFMDVWRSFLLHLYRISLVQAPLPIERYIINFVAEVPLPPQGKIEVKLGFTDGDVISISRPAFNRLPLVGFSYRPLFTSLSISNIMVIMGLLLQESRVVLCSKNYSIICPIAESFLSFLFPFCWQGIFIPITPYSMLDILDAPVPFFLGLHSRYLQEVKPEDRPIGVVFVDLDEDIVHLGYSEEESGERKLPCFPERSAAKLKLALKEIFPSSGLAHGITTGNGNPLRNSQRYVYCQEKMATSTQDRDRRKELLDQSDRAFLDNDHLLPITGFASDVGTLRRNDEAMDDLFYIKGMKKKKQQKGATTTTTITTEVKTVHILETTKDENQPHIRNAFLRFVISMFKNYDKCIDCKAQYPTFDEEKFLSDFNKHSDKVKFYLSKVVKTQMFLRFIEEKRSNHHPDLRFFDDMILAKKNRSKKKALTSRKKETSFLFDESGKITETYLPPPPNNTSLPGDKRLYHYGKFPKLNSDLLVSPRKPKQWEQFAMERDRYLLSSAIHKQSCIMSQLLSTDFSLFKDEEVRYKDLEWALRTISYAEDLKYGSNRIKGETAQGPLILEAQNIVRMARKDQVNTIARTIQIQAHWRRHIMEKHYIVKNELRFHSQYNIQVSEDSLENRLSLKHTSFVIRIQRLTRGFLTRMTLHRSRAAILTLQSHYHRRHTQCLFRTVLVMVSRIQALARGVIARSRLNKLISCRLDAYRTQIFYLWRHAKTPLAYRSRFWIHNIDEGFIRLTLIENELFRLWKALGVGLGRVNIIRSLDESKDTVYRHYLQVQSKLDESSSDRNDDSKVTLVFPAELNERNKFKENYYQLQNSDKRLKLERMQVYERLQHKSNMHQIYELFNISKDEKNKKKTLSTLVWEPNYDPDVCAQVFHNLFPELEKTFDLAPVLPSKKSLKRMGITNDSGYSSLPSPLTEKAMTRSQVDAIIIEDLAHVSNSLFNSLHLVLSGSKTFENSIEDEPIKQRQYDAVFFNGGKLQEKAKFELLHSFLHEHR